MEHRLEALWDWALADRPELCHYSQQQVVVDRERIARMDGEGYTTREIGAALGISAASVCRILKGYRRNSLADVL